MSVGDILLLSWSFLIIGVWFLVLHLSEQGARKRLGADVVEIPLYRRWWLHVQWGIVALAIVMPVAWIVVAVLEHIPFDEALFTFGRTLWFGSILYGVRKGSVLLIGSRGISLGLKNQIPWDRVEAVTWDRDIGQRLWGMTLTVRHPKGRQLNKQRIYIRRELKAEVVAHVERFGADMAVTGRRVDLLPGDSMALPVRGDQGANSLVPVFGQGSVGTYEGSL